MSGTLSPSPPTIALITLGCKLNQSETDSIATTLEQRGFVIHKHPKMRADYTVINTCTVTAKADRKSRHAIYKALRVAVEGEEKSHPLTRPNNVSVDTVLDPSSTSPTKKGIVIVTGCFVGSGRKEIEGMKVDYIIDNSKKMYIPDIIESHQSGQILDVDALQENYFGYVPTNNTFHVRSNLKIQDGCDNFCTFCIIPIVRGKAQSRPLQDIVQDARLMVEQGTKEIVLTGVNMSRYSYEDYTFSDVLEGLLKLPKDFRLRISSLEPDQIDDKFFELMTSPRMCPHLHLCLQSGSDQILMKMRRMYTSKEFRRCIDAIKVVNPRTNFTTDVIVGFPSESDKHFAESIKLVEYCGFSHVHIFPYSDRTGTRASRMDGGVSIEEKKARIKQLEQLSARQKDQYRLASLGQQQTMLVEKIEKRNGISFASGLTEYYVPVELANTDVQINTLYPVRIQGHRRNNKELIMQAELVEAKT